MRTLLLVLLLLAGNAFGAYQEFYCKTTGSNMNGGSSKTDAAALTKTNGDWSTTTNVFTTTGVTGISAGDWASVYNDGATTPVYGARVTASTSTTITLSSTAKWGTAPTTSATARSIKVGGAWQGPNGTVGFPFGLIANTATDASGNTPRVNFESVGTYSVTAAMTHNLAGPITFQGYTTNAGDGGKGKIDGGTSGAAYALFTVSAANNVFRDLIFSNNGATGTADGFTSSAAVHIDRCVFHDFRGNGFICSSNPNVVESEAYLCNASNTAASGGFKQGAGSGIYTRCISHDNAGSNSSGFVTTNISVLVNCIADTNGANGFFLSGATTSVEAHGSVFYNNTGSGIAGGAVASQKIIAGNCIFQSNGAYGVNLGTSTSGFARLINNGYNGNTTAPTNFAVAVAAEETGAITLGSDPFTAAGTGDFDLTLAGAKGTGRGTFTQTQASYTGTLGVPDLGAAQSAGGVAGGETSSFYAE